MRELCLDIATSQSKKSASSEEKLIGTGNESHCLKSQCNRYREMRCACPIENCFHQRVKEPSMQEG